MIKAPGDLFPYILILAMFFLGTGYHISIYQSCIYHVKLTKSMKVILFFIPILLMGMAYFVGEKSLYKYPLSIMASVFLMSQPLAEGISEKGIYYRPLGSSMVLKLAKWESVKDVKIASDHYKLKSLTYKKRRIYPAHSYSPEDFGKVIIYIDKMAEHANCHE